MRYFSAHVLPVFLLLLVVGPAVGCGGGGESPPQEAVALLPVSFVHEATVANTVLGKTFIDHPLLNGQPERIVIVTLMQNPGGIFPGFGSNGPLIARYVLPDARWAIHVLDSGDASELAFNVTILEAGANAFVHTTTVANTTVAHTTTLSHPALDGNPAGRVLVTMRLHEGPGGGIGTHSENRHQIGVFYTGSKWAIYNIDLVAMPLDTQFHVHVLGAETMQLAHAVTPATLMAPGLAFRSFIDDPRLNGRPDAVIHAIALFRVPGSAAGGAYHDVLPNLFYDPVAGMWMISEPFAAPYPSDVIFLVAEPPLAP